MKKERVLIVVIDYRRPVEWRIEDIADELAELAIACGGDVIDRMICKVDQASAAHIIGKGKVEEIAGVCSGLEIDTVIFSHDLTGSQQRNIDSKRCTGCRV